MALEVGAAVVSLIPSAKDFSATARRLLKSEMSGIGEQIGKGFGREFSDSAGKTSGKGLVDGVKKQSKSIEDEGERAGKGYAGRFGSGLKSTLGPLAAGLMAGIGVEKIFSGLVDAGVKASQANATGTAVWGAQFDAVKKQAEGAYKTIGMGTADYVKQSSLVKQLLSSSGLAGSFDQVNRLMTDAADLGARWGTTTEEAADAATAALRGEYDQLEKYGVKISENTIAAYLQAKGVQKVNGAYTDAQKAEATLNLIHDKSASSRGAAAEKMGTYAGQVEQARASVQNLAGKIGEALMPMLSDLMKWVNEVVVPGLQDFVKGFQDSTGAGGEFRSILEKVRDVVVPVFSFIKDNIGWLAPLAAGFVLASWAVGLFNLALMANPIGLVVGGIAILIGALVALYNGNESVRNVVDTCWGAIKNAIGAVAGWITDTAIPGIVGAWNAMGDGLSKVGDSIAATWESIKDKVKKPISFVVNTVVRDGVVAAWNAVATKVGLDTWDFKGVGWASGGYTGPGGKYEPAGIVHKDEFVIRKEARGAFEASHPGALDYLNRTGRLPGYADGGMVFANPVGSGLKKLLELPFSAVKGLIDGIGSRFGDSDWVRLSTEFAKKPVTSTKDFLDKLIDKVFPSITWNGSAGAEQWASLGAKALEMTGQPLSLLGSLLRRMMQESGGNPTAINNWDSNAAAGIPSKGLMQVIDPTFRAYAMPGYDSDIWDPLSNILASIRYALSRYGSLSSAYDRAGGYAEGGRVRGPLLFDQGGYLPPGLSLVANHTGQPERVLNPSQEARLGAGSVYNIDVRGFSADEVVEKMVGSLDHASRKSRLARHLR